MGKVYLDTRDLADRLHQFEHRHLVRVADVHRTDVVTPEEAKNTGDQVIDVTEGAGL